MRILDILYASPSYLKRATNRELKDLLELVYNLAVGNIPLTKRNKQLLSRHRRLFAKLTSRHSLRLKYRLLKTSHKFVVLLLKALKPWHNAAQKVCNGSVRKIRSIDTR